MSILSDYDIRKAIKDGRIILSLDISSDCFQPASLELHLGNHIIRFNSDGESFDQFYLTEQILTIKSQEFLLAETLESIAIDNTLAANVEGKSSLGRQGIFIHISAGFIDPGFNGILTLEVYNASPITRTLRINQKFCQIKFQELKTPAERPYGHTELGSHYQNSTKVEKSKL